MEKEVLAVIATVLGFEISEVYPEADLKNDLIIDDLDYIEIMLNLEDEFCVALTEDVTSKFKTVKDIIEYIENERRKR